MQTRRGALVIKGDAYGGKIMVQSWRLIGLSSVLFLLLSGCGKKVAVQVPTAVEDAPGVVALGQCECLLAYPVPPGAQSPELEQCMIDLFHAHSATIPTPEMETFQWTPPAEPGAPEGEQVPPILVPRVFPTEAQMARYAEVSYACTRTVMTTAYNYSRMVWSEAPCAEQCLDMPEKSRRLCETVCVTVQSQPSE